MVQTVIAKKKIDEAYATEPWWYDFRGFLILTFAYRSSLPAQIRFFSRNVGKEHLEVAIGSGTLFNLVLKWRKWKQLPDSEVTGFDYADKMLAGAKRRFGKNKNIHLVKADAADLPFANEVFASANVANAIHCLPDVRASLSELFRVLRPAGLLAGNCLLVPAGRGPLALLANAINGWGMRVGILERPYSANEIRDLLLEAGFKVLYERIHGNCYDFIAKKEKSLFGP